jgi:phage gpG-like protein
VATPRQAREALLAFKKGVPIAVLRGLRKGMPIAVRIATRNYMERKDNRHPFQSNDPPNFPPGPLGIRQGNLVRTVKVGDLRFTGSKVIASIKAGNADVRYAGIHEFGGEILAKNGPYLVFPMAAPGGGYFIVKKPKVLIPARPFLRPAMEDATPQIVEIVQKELLKLARATLRGVARFK